MDYVKIILTSYTGLDRMIAGFRESINSRCKNSIYNYEPAETTCRKIIEKKVVLEKLIDLKRKLDILISRLDEGEKALIYLKYFDIVPDYKFKYTSRTYYRKQIKLLKKIETFLHYLGITEEKFKKDYMDIAYFKMISIKCELNKRKMGATSLEKKFFTK